jgi:hypothetical protein
MRLLPSRWVRHAIAIAIVVGATTAVPTPTSATHNGPPLWEQLGGTLTSAPDVAEVPGPGPNVFYFARGIDNAIWRRTEFAGSWTSLGGLATSGPGVAHTSGTPGDSSPPIGRIDLFVRGSDGALWHRTMYGSGPSNLWTRWASLGGIITSDPAAVSTGNPHNDTFELTVAARGTDGALWTRHVTGTQEWGPWTVTWSAVPMTPPGCGATARPHGTRWAAS